MPKQYRKVVTYGSRSKDHVNPCDKVEQVLNRLERNYYYVAVSMRFDYRRIRHLIAGGLPVNTELDFEQGNLIPLYTLWKALERLSKHDLYLTLTNRAKTMSNCSNLIKKVSLIKAADLERRVTA